MELAIQVLQIIFYSIASIFMIALTIISIWGFIIYNKNSKTLKAQNYILEKIFQAVNYNSNKSSAFLKKTIDESNDLLDENIDKKYR
ncbi:MAG: hypothetical protein GX258_02575 [Clostridiales bacterium]|nr:hypothetical protein [Clostridiales bacterium]